MKIGFPVGRLAIIMLQPGCAFSARQNELRTAHSREIANAPYARDSLAPFVLPFPHKAYWALRGPHAENH